MQQNKTKRLIPGVEILRFYMCFMVVCTHFGGVALTKVTALFYIFQPYHVAVFMLLSFILCGHYFLEPNKELIIKRVLRLLIPFVAWGILSYLFALCFWKLDISVLGWQLIGGHSINLSLWFLITALIISLLFWLIRLIPNNKIFIAIILLLGVISFVLQYTGLNYKMFSGLPYELEYPLGRIFEMIPYASLGVLLSIFVPKIINLNFKSQLIIFASAVLGLVVYCVLNYFVDFYDPNGFDYPGIPMVFVAFLLVATAFTNPINFVSNEKVLNAIKWATSFTMGVFCMHVIFGRFIEYIFVSFNWPIHNVLVALTTYLVCYLVGFCINLIPCKYTKMLVN